MNIQLLGACALLLAATSAIAELDVDVNVNLGAPDYYGRIDLDDYPRPQLIYTEPRIIMPRVGVVAAPVYLHVPPGHAKDWDKHCSKYNACGDRVFFVQPEWYTTTYVPAFKAKHHGKGHGDGPGHSGKGHKDKGNKK